MSIYILLRVILVHVQASYETKEGAADRWGMLKLKYEVRLPDAILHFDGAGGGEQQGEC